jgi:hypothetical protein
LAFTSREIVDGTRPSRGAIDRSESPAAKPLEISSRSASDSLSGDRFGAGFGSRCSALAARRIAHRDRLISRCNRRAGAPPHQLSDPVLLLPTAATASLTSSSWQRPVGSPAVL